MTKANKEILQTYRKLQKEFDESQTWADWIARQCRVLADTSPNVSCKTFNRLVTSICE